MVAKNETIDIYGVGTSVSLTESVDAKVIAVAIHNNDAVMYECAWWNGDNRTKDWFSSDDFLSVGEKESVKKIGFMSG